MKALSEMWIALAIAVVIGLVSFQVQAQTTYVVCGSLRDNKVQAVFPNSCPSGWYFIKYA